MLDTEKLFGSPIADRERWDARRQAAYQAGISVLPPDATSVMLAARMDNENCQSAAGKDDEVILRSKRFPGTGTRRQDRHCASIQKTGQLPEVVAREENRTVDGKDREMLFRRLRNVEFAGGPRDGYRQDIRL